jgi:hypothetical protein
VLIVLRNAREPYGYKQRRANNAASQIRAAFLIGRFPGMRHVLVAAGLMLAVLTTASAGAAFAADDTKAMTPEQRMQARYPQPVRVGDLIGLPLLDDSHSTLGHIRDVVRTKDDKIELIVAYGGFLGWGTRPIAVPIEVVGIRGRELASLDMPRDEYRTAPTWRRADAAIVPLDTSILVALCRGY